MVGYMGVHGPVPVYCRCEYVYDVTLCDECGFNRVVVVVVEMLSSASRPCAARLVASLVAGLALASCVAGARVMLDSASTSNGTFPLQQNTTVLPPFTSVSR